MATNVPRPTFGPTGFIPPAESAILAGRQADIDAALGGGVNMALSTPQGQLASSDTAIIGNCNDQFLELVNGVDPAYADGRMQDGIGRIYFIDRIPAAATVVQAVCNGAVGVVIPAGALIRDSAENLYTATAGGTIPGGGTITLSFACTVTGPVVCPPQTFQIAQAVPGWDTAISSAAGTVGNDVESRSAFEARRRASVAVNALGSVPSILGAVLAVDGVLDAYVVDNPTGSTVTIGGVSLLPHSLYVAATGGVAADIARAIWKRKSIGCDYVGTTTVTLQDTASGYSPPLPTYTVKFTIPTSTPVLFAVRIADNPAVPPTAVALIQAAIVSAFSGGDDGPRARIGGTLYASRFYSAVASVGSWVQIISIHLGISVANQDSVSLHINQAPVTSADTITVDVVS